MIVVDPGHEYTLSILDAEEDDDRVMLRFVKREGDGYPGNVGHHSGTTTQEVLRALIDRAKYVDRQIHDEANTHVLKNLRWAIYFLEERAARRHGRTLPLRVSSGCHGVNGHGIEDESTCARCGHIGCEGECHG